MAKQHEILPVIKVLNQYSEAHQSPTNKLLQWIYVPLLSFGLLGLIWAIPFPHLNFLGRYNGFVNWASFLIAFSIYYYYKLSPLLSYGMLLVVFAFSAGIVSLEKLHTNQGWPQLPQVCLIIFILGLLLQFIGYSAEGKIPSFITNLKFLLTGPMWLIHQLLKKVRLIH
ncbi:Mpo1 family 2-hydroxy fatty acid dioxygenase [Desertivirga xinjiangensis]|uniref:Mpo1 family 2-hydroxy fatty acid dioxygenase n=1 Tax=Desertivirga xinjiangensis TaxID=539206 RepID=UPI00210B31D7|nr:Mpo1-like protein [Pedobacter xinjiangensis]